MVQTPHSNESKKVTNKCRLDMNSKAEYLDPPFERVQLLSLPLDFSSCSGCSVLGRLCFLLTKHPCDASVLFVCYF